MTIKCLEYLHSLCSISVVAFSVFSVLVSSEFSVVASSVFSVLVSSEFSVT